MSAKNLLSDAELLARLVGFDSTSHRSNRPIAFFLADYLDRPGIRVEQNPSADGEKTNLVVTVGGDADPAARRGLVLSGHMDVVPAGEEEWRSDPFELVETAEGYFGRGACDMKGFVALATNAAARGAASGVRHPLVLVLTYDEEVGLLGARRFAETWERPLPRAAIIGEPTQLRAVRLHKGISQHRLTVRGQSAHSGYPHLGHNAIEPAARAVVALSELRRTLEGESCPNREHYPETPFVALNVGVIEGGSADNVVPDRCVVDLSFRVLPGMESGPVQERIREALDGALAGESWELVMTTESPPLEVAETSEIHRAVCGLIGQEKTEAVSYATDGSWLQRAGLDSLIFGPGSIAVAHKPNEWMPKDEFHRTAGLLDQLVERFCRAG